jgi:L-serine deaminase
MEVHDARKQTSAAPAILRGGFREEAVREPLLGMVIDPVGELVCLTVYKKGAMEVVRRLAA